MSKIFQLKNPAPIQIPSDSTSFLHFEKSNLATDFYPNTESSLIDDWDLICQFNHEPVLLLDHERRIIKVNQQFCDLTGYDSEDLKGLLFKEICTLPDTLFDTLSMSYQKGVLNKHIVVPFFTRSSTLVYGKVTLAKPLESEIASYTFQLTVSDVSDFVKTNKGLRKQIARMRREEATESMIDKSKKPNLEKIRDRAKSLLSIYPSNALSNELRRIVQALDTELEGINGKQTFLQHFEKTCPSFSIQLLDRCPSLTAAEVKHCAYVYMQLSPYEVAQILGINRKSVEMARYRIKKKMDLDKKESLRLVLIDLAKRGDAVKYTGLQLSL